SLGKAAVTAVLWGRAISVAGRCRAANQPETQHSSRGRYRQLEEIGSCLREVGYRQFIGGEPCLQDRAECRPPQLGGLAYDQDAVMACILHQALDQLDRRRA